MDRSKRQRNTRLEWLERQNGLVDRSQEDCIELHKRNRKTIPVWVAIEVWDFGTLSKHYEILKGNHQNHIAQRLGVSNTSNHAPHAIGHRTRTATADYPDR